MFLVDECDLSLVFWDVLLQKRGFVWVNLVKVVVSHKFLIEWVKLIFKLRNLEGWSAVPGPVLQVIFLQFGSLSFFLLQSFLHYLKLIGQIVVFYLKRLFLLFIMLSLGLEGCIYIFKFSILLSESCNLLCKFLVSLSLFNYIFHQLFVFFLTDVFHHTDSTSIQLALVCYVW